MKIIPAQGTTNILHQDTHRIKNIVIILVILTVNGQFFLSLIWFRVLVGNLSEPDGLPDNGRVVGSMGADYRRIEDLH